jgi:hypothetical protein
LTHPSTRVKMKGEERAKIRRGTFRFSHSSAHESPITAKT